MYELSIETSGTHGENVWVTKLLHVHYFADDLRVEAIDIFFRERNVHLLDRHKLLALFLCDKRQKCKNATSCHGHSVRREVTIVS